MKTTSKTNTLITTIIAAGALAALSAKAQSYTVSYYDGGTWNTVYAQGFSTSLGATPVPGASAGDTVNLTQFQFFKSGNSDSAANIQLAIFNTMYPNTVGLSTSSSSFVGLSANTIASTASLNTWDAITFTFNNLALTYGNDYSAVFVNVSGTSLTPVLVSALTANYVDAGGGDYHPASNYGTETEWDYTTSNYINNYGYFSAFGYTGDADFAATLTTVPEPATGAVMGLGVILALALRRRNAGR